jgi:N,N'-diacetylchitobiose non-reducing end deacetylase
MPKTVLVLTPHPDDLEFYAAGTFARLVAAGARGIIVIATDGSKGSLLEDGQTLIRLRRDEARCAAAVLGAEAPIMLGHTDWELDRLAPGALREEFIRLIRQYRPDVLIAQDPHASFEHHQDHRAAAWAALEAARSAPLPLVHPEHRLAGLEPHVVAEKYWYATYDNSLVNKVVDVSETLEQRLAALAEHRSQIRSMAEGLRRQALVAGLTDGETQQVLPADPMAALAEAMRRQASELGARIGVRYGEAFRYERFDPAIEELLAARASG